MFRVHPFIQFLVYFGGDDVISLAAGVDIIDCNSPFIWYIKLLNPGQKQNPITTVNAGRSVIKT